MTPGELQWLSGHLGHDISTHKKNYRLHSIAVEIAKVGKLLLDVDGYGQAGKRNKMQGMHLRDCTKAR